VLQQQGTGVISSLFVPCNIREELNVLKFTSFNLRGKRRGGKKRFLGKVGNPGILGEKWVNSIQTESKSIFPSEKKRKRTECTVQKEKKSKTFMQTH